MVDVLEKGVFRDFERSLAIAEDFRSEDILQIKYCPAFKTYQADAYAHLVEGKRRQLNQFRYINLLGLELHTRSRTSKLRSSGVLAWCFRSLELLSMRHQPF